MRVFQIAARLGVKLLGPANIITGCAAVVLGLGLFDAKSVEAVVVISDGFGDADRDNKNGALQLSDTDVNLDEAIGTYEPTQADMEDTIYPDGTLINEVVAVEDAADIGIAWYNSRGFTSSGDSKPNIKIVDDSVGNFPETNGVGSQAVEAIDNGLALAFESKGRGSSATGFFGQTIELGPEVGDQVKVSFDFRIWLSAPNFNGSANNHIPEEAELRFGLFEDTDGQLGMTNPEAGRGQTPAVWGQEDGLFRGRDPGVGARDDHGWFVKAPIENPGGTFVPLEDGASARIVEELNDTDDFLNGTTDTVASPNQADPQFVNLNIHNVYNLGLTLERFDDPDTPGTDGDTILATYTVIERSSGQTWELSDYEEVGVEGTNDPDGGIESDKWDYFGLNTRSLDEIDWIIDNFALEIIGSNEPSTGDPADLNADGFVDGLDLGILLGNFNKSGIEPAGGELNGTDPVDGLDLGILLGSWSPAAASGLAAVPEPSSLLLLTLGLGGMVSRRRLLGQRRSQ